MNKTQSQLWSATNSTYDQFGVSQWFVTDQSNYYETLIEESNLSEENKENLKKVPLEYYSRETNTTTFTSLLDVKNQSHINTHLADINEMTLALALVGFDYHDIGNTGEVEDTLYAKWSELSKVNILQLTNAMISGTKMAEIFTDAYYTPDRVWWTARPTSNMSKDNPTDVLTQYRGNLLGISAKNSSSKKDLSFKNMGAAKLSELLSTSFQPVIEQLMNRALDNYPDLVGITANSRKYKIRLDPELQDKTRLSGGIVVSEYIEYLLSVIQSAPLTSKVELVKHLLGLIQEDKIPYVKITSYGDNSISIVDPSKDEVNDQLDDPNVNLHFGRLTNNTISVMINNRRLLKIRGKWTSEPLASSIKILGEPW